MKSEPKEALNFILRGLILCGSASYLKMKARFFQCVAGSGRPERSDVDVDFLELRTEGFGQFSSLATRYIPECVGCLMLAKKTDTARIPRVPKPKISSEDLRVPGDFHGCRCPGRFRSRNTGLWVYGAVCFRASLLNCSTACTGGFVVPEGKTVPHSALRGFRTCQLGFVEWSSLGIRGRRHAMRRLAARLKLWSCGFKIPRRRIPLLSTPCEV